MPVHGRNMTLCMNIEAHIGSLEESSRSEREWARQASELKSMTRSRDNYKTKSLQLGSDLRSVEAQLKTAKSVNAKFGVSNHLPRTNMTGPREARKLKKKVGSILRPYSEARQSTAAVSVVQSHPIAKEKIYQDAIPRFNSESTKIKKEQRRDNKELARRLIVNKCRKTTTHRQFHGGRLAFEYKKQEYEPDPKRPG